MEIEIKEDKLEIEFGKYGEENYIKLEIKNPPEKWQESWDSLKKIAENVLTLKCQKK